MSFSPSPRYLLVTLLEEIEKKQNADSEATAFASIVLPVPVPCGKDMRCVQSAQKGNEERPDQRNHNEKEIPGAILHPF
jgi:hypothetical protein